jgi:predicted kinase
MTSDFIENRFDYSGGRETAPELTIMVGLSGSGKSTAAKSWVNWGRGQVVRLNRDSMRAMMYVDVPWTAHHDDVIRVVQKDMARTALRMGKNVIIDDTNCVRKTRQAWEELAKECRTKFRIVTMTTPFDVCVERDAQRTDKEHVGKEVILRQRKQLNEFKIDLENTPVSYSRPVFEREALLTGGFTKRLPDAPFVIVDVDGTVANHTGHRDPYNEKLVLLDSVYEVVADWVRALQPFYNILIVSGRHDTCGDDTCEWFEGNNIPFDHILMRRGGDNRSDFIVKQEILDEFLSVFSKEDIAFVLDDRPQVVRMWKKNGLTVYPVRGTTLHRQGCSFESQRGYRTCPECGALEDF